MLHRLTHRTHSHIRTRTSLFSTQRTCTALQLYQTQHTATSPSHLAAAAAPRRISPPLRSHSTMAAPKNAIPTDVKGSWSTSIQNGEFKRKDSIFRNWITSDGEFKPEKGRYHLYVSHACPWAHRTLIVRGLKGLEAAISFSVVDWFLDGSRGWVFNPSQVGGGCTADDVNGFERLKDVYLQSDPQYSGNVTVPVLYDKHTKRIVNNESSEIIQMLNNQFNEFAATKEQAALDLYPASLKAEIDTVNGWIYPSINNGVYRCGFATEQAAYDKAFDELFTALDRAEKLLSTQRFLNSNTDITLADVRLFTTLIRFDSVYHGHFKTNRRKLSEYPHLYGYTRELYQRPEIRSTVNHYHIKHHYMASHKSINPHGIVSHGPPEELLDQPHGRDNVGAK